jgi:hypothetical protein
MTMVKFMKIQNDNKAFASMSLDADFKLDDDLNVKDPSPEEVKHLFEINGLKQLVEIHDSLDLRAMQ